MSASAFGNHVKEKHNGRRFFCDHCSYSSNKANCVYDHRLKLHNVLSGDHTLYKCLVESCTFKTIEHFSIITHVRQVWQLTDFVLNFALCKYKSPWKTCLSLFNEDKIDEN